MAVRYPAASRISDTNSARSKSSSTIRMSFAIERRDSRRNAVFEELATVRFAGTYVARCRIEARPAKSFPGLETFTDIEDQKRVQAIQAEFKSTLDAEPDAVIFFEPTSGRILYVNHGASVLLGYSRDELLRMAPADFMAEHDAIAFREVLAPLLEGAQPHILLETKFRRKDPSAVPIDVSLQLIRIG